MWNIKKTVAILLVGSFVFISGMPAFAADVTLSELQGDTVALASVASVQPRAASYEITGDGVRLRSEPSLAGNTIGYLNKGDIVVAGHGEEEVYADGYYWLPVQVVTGNLTGSTGWVATAYMLEVG